jgi:beta-glucosidase
MAGTDQFGGMGMPPAHTEYMHRAFELLEERHGYEFMRARLEDSARRITRNFFTIGLFDNPFLDVTESMEIIMNADHMARGAEAQTQSIIMLKNDGVISEDWAGDRPRVYIPMTLLGGGAHTGGIPHWSIGHRVPLTILEEYFDVVTDTAATTLTGVTATAGAAEGTTFASPDDIIRASAEEIADVDFILVFMVDPLNAASNWNIGIAHDHWAHGPVPTWDYHLINTNHITYIPISLQFRPYRAVNDYVRSTSIAGRSIMWSLEELYGPEEFYERENRSYFGQRSDIMNEHELDFLMEVIENAPAGVPIIVAMNASRGYIFAEFEEYVDAIFLGFGVDNATFIPLVLGHAEPSGLLPIAMPEDMLAVQRQLEDVPRDMDVFVDSMGNAYDFAFGLNWDGVIEDWRTERFNVAPIVSPERQPVHRPEGITR